MLGCPCQALPSAWFSPVVSQGRRPSPPAAHARRLLCGAGGKTREGTQRVWGGRKHESKLVARSLQLLSDRGGRGQASEVTVQSLVCSGALPFRLRPENRRNEVRFAEF